MSGENVIYFGGDNDDDAQPRHALYQPFGSRQCGDDGSMDSSRADGVPQPRRAQPQPQPRGDGAGEWRRGDGVPAPALSTQPVLGGRDGGSLGWSRADGSGDGAAGISSGGQVRRDDVLLRVEVYAEYSDKLKIMHFEASFVQKAPSSEILVTSQGFWGQP